MSIPMYLRGEGEEGRQINKEQHPYRKLSVIILLSRPSIVFSPRQILFTPVPLSKSTETMLSLHIAGYPWLVHRDTPKAAMFVCKQSNNEDGFLLHFLIGGNKPSVLSLLC